MPKFDFIVLSYFLRPNGKYLFGLSLCWRWVCWCVCGSLACIWSNIKSWRVHNFPFIADIFIPSLHMFDMTLIMLYFVFFSRSKLNFLDYSSDKLIVLMLFWFEIQAWCCLQKTLPSLPSFNLNVSYLYFNLLFDFQVFTKIFAIF